VTTGLWLRMATAQLATAQVQTARLDALLLLCDELGEDKAWMLAHPEHTPSNQQLQSLAAKLKRRLQHEPMAYIRGKQAFFGRDFTVTLATLIPRPETESLVELLLALPHNSGDKVLDIGTGTGCIAITAKLEAPELQVFASDISEDALAAARHNAQQLGATVTFYKQDMFDDETSGPYKFIVSNLPYVSRKWQRSPETNFEPSSALFAKDDGLALIKRLITQASPHLKSHGYLLLEADPRQHPAIRDFAKQHGYILYGQQGFCLVLQTAK
jgi:release factor glutamine methyltransferase